MDRRAFVGSVGALVSAVSVGWSQEQASGGQQAQGEGDAGRLYNPNVVQQRRRSTDADNDEYIKNIEKQMRCTCGCNLDIYTCRTTDFTCTTSPALHREVLALNEAGLSAEDILEDFMGRYGDDILMAPKPEGFNLAGYLVPGVLITSIGMALTWVLYRRQMTARAARAAGAAGAVGAVGAGGEGVAATAEELERL
ncbi:MAG: cytochrome c-type biogenesis protein CcmH, partial [Gemmatimonadales bacterium]